MKYLLCIADGMADYPLDELDGLSPLQYAKTPWMDNLASDGTCGLVRTVPRSFAPGSDVAHISIFGYDPKKNYCGRALLDITDAGIRLNPRQMVFRCDLVTESNGLLIDCKADNITDEEAAELVRALNENIGLPGVSFHSCNGYKNILLIDQEEAGKELGQLLCVSPHDVVGRKIETNLPTGTGAVFLHDIITRAAQVLSNHEINVVKIDLQENPANFIWPWGMSMAVTLDQYDKLYGVTGAIVSDSGLVRGLGKLCGLHVLDMPQIPGSFDAGFTNKTQAALSALNDHDLVIVHVAAPDEASHAGSLAEKIKAIENIDELIVGPLLERLPDIVSQGWRFMLLSDQVTPVKLRHHVSDPVPCVLTGEGIVADSVSEYNEIAVKKGALKARYGHSLMPLLLAQKK